MIDWLHPYTGGGDRPDPLKGALAGAAGGFVGSLRMGRLTALWNRMNGRLEASDNERLQPAVESRGQADDPLPNYGDREQAAAERKVAAKAIRSATGRSPGEHEEAIGGEVVHHLTGIIAGAIYGAACEYLPALKKGYGLPLGIGMFLIGREAGQFAVGVSSRPDRQATTDHLVGLGSHLAYGFFAEITRAKLRQALAEEE